jgi:hypothetical protein
VRQVPNADPLGTPDAYAVDEDGTLVVPAAEGVLANDGDGDADGLTATVEGPPFHGTLDLNPDGSFTYTPEPDFFGGDGFLYRVTDGLGGSAVVAVEINVNSVPDAGKLAFSASEFHATEHDGTGIVTVVRTGGTDDFASVSYALTAATATENQDYFGAAGSLLFFPGETAQDIYVGVVNDGEPEPAETILVTLSDPDGATFAGDANPTATLTIASSAGLPSLSVPTRRRSSRATRAGPR